MKHTLFATLALLTLTAFLGSLAGNDVIYHISNYARSPQWPIAYVDEQDLAQAVAAYGSSEALMRELREAMRAKPEGNGAVHRTVWEFVRGQRHRLPFTEEDFEYFFTWAGFERVCYERNTSIACLAAGKRKEALPLLRRMMEGNNATEALDALEMLADYGPWLPEEDIDRVIVLLYDTREVQLRHEIHYTGEWFLAFHAMQTLAKIGPRAVRAYDVICEQLLHCDNYDAAKFAAFLEKIRDPGLTPESFWRLVDEAGLKVKREYSQHEDLVRWLARREQFPREDDEPDFTEYPPELLATVARAIAGGTQYELYDPAKIPSLTPREEIKRDISKNYQPALTLLALNPDDPRGLFLLLEYMFSRHEITNTGRPIQFVGATFLSQDRAFLPIIDLLLRHPEMLDTYQTNYLFLHMPGDPERPWQKDMNLEKAKLDALGDVLYAAFECELTEAECLRYAGIYLDMPESGSLRYPSDSLAEHQQKHHGAIVAMMKTRMTTEPEDSPAYNRAEECLRGVGELEEE